MKILELIDIEKSFGEKKVLDKVSLHLDKGEIVGLLGISGSGKSTIFNIISGNILPDGGNVILNGEDITGDTGCVSYMLQKDLLLRHMTVLENAALPLILAGIPKKDALKTAEEYFDEFGIKGIEYKYPSQISGGMRQRVALLRTYLNKKDVVLLDEPFSALDMLTKAKLHQWFLEIIQKIDLSGIFISHDIDEAIFLSDRIYILNTKGKIEDEIKIEYQKKRDDEFKLSEDFLKYKRQIVEKLRD